MTEDRSRPANILRRAAAAALLSTLLASCTSTSDPALELSAAAHQEVAADAAADKAGKLSLAAEEAGADDEKNAKAAGVKAEASSANQSAAGSDKTDAISTTDATAKAESPSTTDGKSQAAAAIDAKKRGFMSAFFTPAQPNDAAAAIALKKAASGADEGKPLVDEAATRPLVDKDAKARPLVKLASAEAGNPEPLKASLTSMDALPGVRSGDQLFEITRKSGMDSDTSDVDVYENPGSYEVASAAGFGRMGAHGLLRQRPDVDVSCLKPGLVNMLHNIESHYGKKILVTSGYRSPSHNKAVHGAQHSMHMFCSAADIKVDGVSKWELARYVRALPGRGGVGTYCHTNAIHVDVGPERDWNWRCRRGG